MQGMTQRYDIAMPVDLAIGRYSALGKDLLGPGRRGGSDFLDRGWISGGMDAVVAYVVRGTCTYARYLICGVVAQIYLEIEIVANIR
jgi:hypothetical protein